MKKCLPIFLLLLCSACATTHHESPIGASKTERFPDAPMNDLVIFAMSMAETPYRYGGTSPETGFDCSGFVRHVFQKSLGLQLPRTSEEMSRAGKQINGDQLRPGDLVFFNTQQKPFSHVGIYVGEGRFVHAPKSGKSIMIVDMHEDYWQRRYDGARRIFPP